MQSITIKNFRGCEEAEIDLDPIALVCGKNGAGKSSIAQAVAATLIRSPAPIQGVTKTAAKAMLRDGTKRGKCTVADDSGTASVNWPGGTVNDEEGPKASLIAAGIQSLATMKPKDASDFLINILDAMPTKEHLKAALGSLNDDMVDAIWNRIEKDGWDKAHARAKERGQQYKGMWEQVTGEKWGSKKGETWGDDISGDEVSLEEIAALEEKRQTLRDNKIRLSADINRIRQNNTKLPALKEELDQCETSATVEQLESTYEEAIKNQATDENVRNDLQAKVDKEDEHRERLDELSVDLTSAIRRRNEWQEEYDKVEKPQQLTQQYTCPCCHEQLVFDADDNLAKYEGISAEQNEMLADQANRVQGNLAETMRECDEITAEVEAVNQLIKECEEARSKLEQLPDGDVTADELSRLKMAITKAKRARQIEEEIKVIETEELGAQELEKEMVTDEELEVMRRDILAKKEAVQVRAKKDEAAKHHLAIISNNQIIDVLAPDGIRRQVLASKLSNINERLQMMADVSGWAPVKISDSLTIDVGKLPYWLLSESEKFRVRVMLQVVVADLDHSSLLVIDAADILDKGGRNGLFALLNMTGMYALVCMTMESPQEVPNLKAAGFGLSYWIGDAVAAQIN